MVLSQYEKTFQMKESTRLEETEAEAKVRQEKWAPSVHCATFQGAGPSCLHLLTQRRKKRKQITVSFAPLDTLHQKYNDTATDTLHNRLNQLQL